MIHENIELTGSFTVSGSFVLPNHSTAASLVEETGSMYHDTVDGVLKVYTGTQWVTVGEQTAPIPPPNTDIEYLLVAGGASGGSNGGGGGAGGYLSSSLASATSGSSFTITVGAGGSNSVSYQAKGNVGVDSSIAGAAISTITAIGGAGGGSNNLRDGDDGGSGGGAGMGASATGTGGSGTVGQGNDGGSTTSTGHPYVGAGGGGAGQVGANGGGSSPGAGGDGLQSPINGTLTYYAGGGGGTGGTGVGYTGPGGSGGQGGGGTGGTYNGNGFNATANTGGGGGASGDATTVGAGGSGVAIFAYQSGSFNCAGGIVGDAGNGRKYNQFNTGGTFKVGNTTTDFQIYTANLVLHLDAGHFASRGTSTWTDLSTNGVNQTVTGATLGQNFYYSFDGSNDSIAVNQNGASPDSNVSHTGYGSFTGAYNNPYTFEFWIRTTDSGGNNIFGQPIVGRDDGDLYGQISVRGGKLSFSLYNGSWEYQESTTSINDGSWHHCVVVHYANQTTDLYVDGTKEVNAASLTLSVTRRFKMTTLMAGYTGEYIAGDLAQFRLYDTTLTSAQVLQNYNATKTNFV